VKRVLFVCRVLCAVAIATHAGASELAADLAGRIAARAPWLQPAAPPEIGRTLDALPIRFEPNRGQADPSAAFVGRANGTLVFVRHRDLTVALPGATPRLVRLRWLGAAEKPALSGEGEQAARAHYFAGRNADSWRTDVPGYDKVRASGVYPGIDLVLYGREAERSEPVLELDFEVAPGADPAAVRFAVEGADRVTLDGDALAIAVGEGTLRVHAPVAYQEHDGVRRPVAARYAIDADGTVRFALGAHDPKLALVIDPVIGYATFLGGTGFDLVHAVAVDPQGRLVVAGRTASTDFPLENPLFSTKGPGFTAFVAKLAPGGNALLWSTFLGGARTCSGNPNGVCGYEQMGVSLDAQGNVAVVGETADASFPLANAWRTTLAGANDAFLTKLAPDGDALVFSTYLGGSGEDYGRGVAFDAEGYVAAVGITFSTNFPLRNATQTTRSGGTDAFVARFYPDGQPIFSTYLGGSALEWGYEVAQSSLGETVVVGYTESADFPTTPGAYQEDFGGGADAFVTRFEPDGLARAFSTFVGGSHYEEALGVALDLDGNPYVVGWTRSTDFPVLNAFQATPQGGDYDAFALKLAADGSALAYSTRLGGGAIDFAYAVAVERDGAATVAGVTTSTNFPTLQPVQAQSGGMDDGFVARLSPAGSQLLFSTYLGGMSLESPFGISLGVAVDPRGQIYAGMSTASPNFPMATQIPTIQATHRGGLDGAIAKLTLDTEVLLRLRPGANGSIGRFRIANGKAANRPVELRFWIESPALPATTGILTITSPLVLPANLAPFDLSFTLPPAIAFPGSRVGLRLLDPVTGDVIGESLCTELPCH